MKDDIEQKKIAAPYELPAGWKWTRLGDVVNIYNGDRGENYPNKKDYVSSGIPFINAGCLENGNINYNLANCITEEKYNSLRAGKILKEDILYCLRGSLGKLGIVREERYGAISSSLCIFRSTENIVPDFLLNVLKSNIIFQQQKKIENGTAQPNLSAKEVAKYIIPLPPTLAEQQRIVSRIESLFTKLEEAKDKAQSVVDGFELRRAAVLHKAFTGELTAKWRKEHGVKDESWKEKRFDEFCLLKRGFDLPATQRIEGKFPLVSSSGIIDSHNEPKVKAPCVVTGRSGSIGKVFYITEDCFPLNTTLYSEKLFGNDAKYVYLYLQTFDFKKYSSSTAVPTLNRNNFADVPVKVPTLPEQQEIVRILDSVLEKEADAKEIAEYVLEQIGLLKKSILARAFRGEL
ncbi:MAG: restriction endonuclease subunit S [Spirochaetaceae bacterium]|nr:restriction endonuclease subunit S [Spirochaetaceae bacterium]